MDQVGQIYKNEQKFTFKIFDDQAGLQLQPYHPYDVVCPS